MAGPALRRPRFALDTNVLIDLGEAKPFAQRFLATYRKAGLAVPPTVIQELVHISRIHHQGGIPPLITSDFHLLAINPAELVQKLDEFDLPSVSIYHPKDILR